ncbi:MAG: hypothetical protein ACE5LH_03680 [Fidelibacterota bacterium]
MNSLLFFAVSLLSISGLLTYLWVYNEINITVKEIDALGRIRETVAAKNIQLTSEIAALKRVDRITRIAEDELHMVTPEPETLVVFFGSDGNFYFSGNK